MPNELEPATPATPAPPAPANPVAQRAEVQLAWPKVVTIAIFVAGGLACVFQGNTVGATALFSMAGGLAVPGLWERIRKDQ